MFLLPFTALEWCHLCMKYGEYYLGGCANLSCVQDIINNVFRFNSGQISVQKLKTIAKTMNEHELLNDISFGDLPNGLESFVKTNLTKKVWKNYDPWDKNSLYLAAC